MAVNYSIQAEVVDITADTPMATDVFLVDTNVWYWMTYSGATAFESSQTNDYPAYLNRSLGIGSKVLHSGLTLAELAHIIEKTEHEIYAKSVTSVNKKEYRHNSASERSRVVSEIEAAWNQITSLAEPLIITIDAPTASAALKRLQTERVDGYDLFILESMKAHGVVQVITDDGDFATVSGIQVFTANRNVIQSAKNQGKLITR
jgi:predicted nucleic acid-binding protein